MKIRKEVDAPTGLQPILGAYWSGQPRCHRRCAKDDHVEATGRHIVEPFRSEASDRVQRGKVSLFCIDKLVPCPVAQVRDVVVEKIVGWGLLGKKDDLGAAFCKFVGYGGSNPRSAALEQKHGH